MQSNNKQLIDNLWGLITAFITSLFSKRSAEDKVTINSSKPEIKISREEARIEIQKLKEQSKIRKKIYVAKKAIKVENVKVGNAVYVQLYDESNAPLAGKSKEVFLSYDEFFITTDKGAHSFHDVYTYHGKPIMA
jgi:hypothetical protein